MSAKSQPVLGAFRPVEVTAIPTRRPRSVIIGLGFCIIIIGVFTAGDRLGTAAPLAFPGAQPGTEIGGSLPSNFEPSGGAWHPRLQRFVTCSDAGKIAVMDRAGGSLTTWTLAGNWEGVAIAEPSSNQVFLVNEDTALVREFDIVTGAAGRAFDLASATPASGVAGLTAIDLDAMRDEGDTTGVEALTFVPDPLAPEGGEFWAGSQENGTVYRFRLSLSSGSTATYLGKFKSWTGNGLQSLEYDWVGGRTVVAVIGGSRLFALSLDGTLLGEWALPSPSGGEEGLGFDGSSLFVAHDPVPAHVVYRYDTVSFGSPATTTTTTSSSTTTTTTSPSTTTTTTTTTSPSTTTTTTSPSTTTTTTSSSVVLRPIGGITIDRAAQSSAARPNRAVRLELPTS